MGCWRFSCVARSDCCFIAPAAWERYPRTSFPFLATGACSPLMFSFDTAKSFRRRNSSWSDCPSFLRGFFASSSVSLRCASPIIWVHRWLGHNVWVHPDFLPLNKTFCWKISEEFRKSWWSWCSGLWAVQSCPNGLITLTICTVRRFKPAGGVLIF